MSRANPAREFAREVAVQMVLNVMSELNNVYVKKFFIVSYVGDSHTIRYTIGIPVRPLPIRKDGCIRLGTFYWSEDFQAEVDRQLRNLMSAKGWVIVEKLAPKPRSKLFHWLFATLGLVRSNLEAQTESHIRTVYFESRTVMDGSVVQLPERS